MSTSWATGERGQVRGARRRRLVHLHRPRRVEGQRAHPLGRPAHVLRDGHRVPLRQVHHPRLRPRDRHLGRGSPGPRLPREGGRGGRGRRPRRPRGPALPARHAPPWQPGGAALQARRRDRDAPATWWTRWARTPRASSSSSPARTRRWTSTWTWRRRSRTRTRSSTCSTPTPASRASSRRRARSHCRPRARTPACWCTRRSRHSCGSCCCCRRWWRRWCWSSRRTTCRTTLRTSPRRSTRSTRSAASSSRTSPRSPLHACTSSRRHRTVLARTLGLMGITAPDSM
jgi:hypothetical protein